MIPEPILMSRVSLTLCSITTSIVPMKIRCLTTAFVDSFSSARPSLSRILSIAAFFASVALPLAFAGLILPEALIAQPALPSEPTQAPIGPGLGALAVAGGAYAMRRLRARRDQMDDVQKDD